MAKKDVVKSVCLRIYEDETELLRLLDGLKGSETVASYLKKAVYYYEEHVNNPQNVNKGNEDGQVVTTLQQISTNMEVLHENMKLLTEKIEKADIVVAKEEKKKSKKANKDLELEIEEEPLAENEIGISTNTDEDIPEEIMGDFMSFLND